MGEDSLMVSPTTSVDGGDEEPTDLKKDMEMDMEESVLSSIKAAVPVFVTALTLKEDAADSAAQSGQTAAETKNKLTHGSDRVTAPASPEPSEQSTRKPVPASERPVLPTKEPSPVRRPAAAAAAEGKAVGAAAGEAAETKETETAREEAPAAALAAPVRVVSVAPSMFVPVAADLMTSFTPPRDRIERADAMIATIDTYRMGVRRGIMHLADLDRHGILAEQAASEERWRQQPKQRQQQTTPDMQAEKSPWPSPSEAATGATGAASPEPAGLPEDFVPTEELDALVMALRAPAVPGVDYNVTPEAMASEMPLHFLPASAGEWAGGRRDYVRQLDDVVERAVINLAGFGVHIATVRRKWTAAREREQQLLDERFGPAPGAAESTGGGELGETNGTSGTRETGETAEAAGATPAAAAAVPAGAVKADAAVKEPADVAMTGT